MGNFDSLEFDLDRKEIPVKLRTKGAVKKYVLREMSGRERDSYLNVLSKRMKTNHDGKTTGLKDFDGLQADLIARCLYEEGSEEPVDVDAIQAFPSSTQTSLHKACKEMNALDVDAKQKDEEAAKNE